MSCWHVIYSTQIILYESSEHKINRISKYYLFLCVLLHIIWYRIYRQNFYLHCMTNERYNLIQLTCIFLRVEHIKTNCEVLYMCSDYFIFLVTLPTHVKKFETEIKSLPKIFKESMLTMNIYNILIIIII